MDFKSWTKLETQVYKNGYVEPGLHCTHLPLQMKRINTTFIGSWFLFSLHTGKNIDDYRLHRIYTPVSTVSVQKQ